MDPWFFKKVLIFPCMFLFPRPWPRKRYIHGPMPFQNRKKVVEYSCMYFSSACMGKIPCMYVCMETSFYVCMSVCRFAKFLRENKHTYIHPHKQTYNSSSRFLHHLKTRIPCMFANAGHGIIQPTWKIYRFFEHPEFQIPRPGRRFLTKT